MAVLTSILFLEAGLLTAFAVYTQLADPGASGASFVSTSYLPLRALDYRHVLPCLALPGWALEI